MINPYDTVIGWEAAAEIAHRIKRDRRLVLEMR